MTSVKDHVLSCLKAFDVLSVTIFTNEAGGDGNDNDILDDGQLQILSLATVNDQVARFKIWAGNIGAHRKGRSSLDYRLREASHIRAQIIRLLGDLWDALQNATSILRGERTPWDKEPVPQEEFSGDELEGIEELVEEAESTELDQISGDISEVIDCLFRLSVSIRNPAPHDRFKRSVWTDTTGQAHFYVAHVREKFKNADEVLTGRLGRANAHRRQYFRYREQHHEKLAGGIDKVHLTATDDAMAMTDTIASSIPQQMKIAGLVGEGGQTQDVIDEDKASTGWTATTIASSLVAGDRERPRIPPLRKGAASRPFECPYCYMVISATTTLAWRRHVFADLRPYICLSPDCHTPEETYTDRHEWMQHMLYHHWRTWTCALGCDECFESATAARNHLAKIHADVSTSEDMESLAGIREGPRSRDAAVDCPLCEESSLTIKEYARHVGRHQKDLSLFTLPPLQDDNDFIDLESSQPTQGNEQSGVDMEDRGDETLDDGDDDDVHIDIMNEGIERSSRSSISSRLLVDPRSTPIFLNAKFYYCNSDEDDDRRQAPAEQAALQTRDKLQAEVEAELEAEREQMQDNFNSNFHDKDYVEIKDTEHERDETLDDNSDKVISEWITPVNPDDGPLDIDFSMDFANPLRSGDVLSDFDFDSFLHDSNTGEEATFDFSGGFMEGGEIGRDSD